MKNYPFIIKLKYAIKDFNGNILGTNFIDKNKTKCKIILNNKEYDLGYDNYKDAIYKEIDKLCAEASKDKNEEEVYDSDRDDGQNNKFFEIQLKILKPLTYMKAMFNENQNLFYISDEFENLDTSEVTNMSLLFRACSNLKKLPNISKWNTAKVQNMNEMFMKCDQLTSLPDISGWDISSVRSLKFMFANCSSLKYLPDISKWDTKNVTDMEGLFLECRSLTSLPDISKWNMSKVELLTDFFNSCCSLLYLPDISKWDTFYVTNMGGLFSNCHSLSVLPDISKWNTSRVKYIYELFYYCYSLSFIPNISKWDLSSLDLDDINGSSNEIYIFKNCFSLTYFPKNTYVKFIKQDLNLINLPLLNKK